VRIGRALYEELVAHALEEAPNECVGMIAARDGEAVSVHRAVNSAASPLRYEIDGMEQ
jgi:proteasome lid subunit RPN8/RPN11